MTDPADAPRAAASTRRLAERGYDGAEGWRRALHQDTHEGIRAEAAFLLGVNAEHGAADDLEAALGDGSARVRVESALALARSGRPAAARPVLRQALQGRFFAEAPLRAARALALLGDASGWPRVLAALASDDAAERMEAVAATPAFVPLAGTRVEGAGEVDPPAALRTALDDAEPIVAGDARAALERITAG